MNRPIRRVVGIVVGILELLMAFAFISMLPKWLNAQQQRFHSASEPAAIALHQRHERVSGAVRPVTNRHFIMEMRLAGSPVIRTETYIAQPDRIFVRTEADGKLLMEFSYDGNVGWSNSPATFNDQLVDGIRAVTASGGTAEVFYAVSTGLMAGMRVRSSGVAGGAGGSAGESLVIMLRDYKRIDGRMESMTNVFRGTGVSGETRMVHLDHEPIDPARFKPPAGLPERPTHP